MQRTLALQTLAGLLLVVTASNAQVDEPQGGAKAQKLFYEGVDALGRHDYEKARTDFEASVALAPRGSALRNLATVDWALGRHAEALRNLRAAVATTDLAAEMRASALKDIEAAYAATGHIVVHTNPGATVRVDGNAEAGLAPLAAPVDVEPGPHVLETRLGDRTGRAEVDAKPGIVVEASALVSPDESPLPAIAPPAAQPLSPTVDRVVATPEHAPHRFWSTQRIAGTLIAAAGAASAAIGAVFYASALSDQDHVRAASAGLGPSSCFGAAQPPACATLSDALSSQQDHAQVSNALLGIGVVAGVVGAAFFFLPERWHGRVAAIAPSVGSHAAGATITGRFW